MKRVVVIGGGVIGVACAHYLQKAGLAVTVVDKGGVGAACSRGNCGFVCPSHVLPLAGPGVIGQTLATLFKKDSPLTVRARFDPDLWGWMLQFARRCNARDMFRSAEGIAALLHSSRRLYDDLFAAEPIQAEWEERGLLFVFQTHHAMEHYSATDRLLTERFNTPATRHEGEKVRELEPALLPGLAGGWHYAGDAHLRPDRLMASWRALLADRGVEFREGCEFLGFVGDRPLRAVATSTGEIPANAAVVATGAWTPLLNKHLGCKVPIQPGKGYSVTLPRPAKCPTIPLIFEEHRVAVTPMQSGYRVGSTMEFAGYDETLNRQRIDLLLRGAAHYLEPAEGPAAEEWWGWRPMVYDGKPVIGPSPARPDVLIAAGHGMLGLSMATGTGKLVAELLTGTTPHVDPAHYAATRF